MKVSRSRMSLAEEWRQSSWMRRAAVLRFSYALLVLALLPILFSAELSLRQIVMPYFAGCTLMIFTSSIQHLFATSLGTPVNEERSQGSPNARYIKIFFTIAPVLRNSEHWRRPFYRVCAVVATSFMFLVGTFFGVFFCPLILVELLLWGIPR